MWFLNGPKINCKAIGNPRKKQGLKVFDNFEHSIDRIWPEEIQMRVLTAAMDSWVKNSTAVLFFHVGMLRFYLTPIFKWNDLTLLKKNMGAFELLFWRENGRV